MPAAPLASVRRQLPSCAAICSRRNATSSSSSSSVVKPAAWRCPPPPPARAIDRDVDLAVGGAQRHLLAVRSAVAGEQLAASAATFVPLDRAQVVDDALGVALLGAGRLEVLARQRGRSSAAPSS